MRPVTRPAMRPVICVLAVTFAGLWAPAPASAQWFVNPFLGTLSKIDFSEPHAESPSVWGIAGGAGAAGFIGGEADYTVSNEFFGSKADIGSNRLRMLTGSVHGGYPIKIDGTTRLRPYAAFGGGLGIANQGIEVFPDFDRIATLPSQRQQQILNCLYPDLEGAEPTRSQIEACGASVIEEESGTGYLGVLSVGGGVFGFIASHVGVRADFRYFWQVPADDEPFNYWRYTIGVVIH
jgi:hypothetical protein